MIPEREIDMDERHFILTQRAGGEERKLVYDYKHCNGCGICVYACPVNAIELGPIHDIAVGLEMPPVTIDHIKCAYCGICYAFCPFNAFEFYIDGEEVPKDSLPLSLTGKTDVLDSCIHCTLCYKACPTEAITREVFITRQDIEEKNPPDVEGKVVVDKDRCNLCGICGEFCQVFVLVDKDVKPDDIMPYEDLLIDEDKCDYCKLCEDICPEEAIKIEGGKRIEYSLPELNKLGKISVNQELCSHCGYCEEICPYEGIRTSKPMEGELFLYEPRMYRCDPVGCGACIKVCKHNRVWYVSRDMGRVHYNGDFCIFCGACENSCPYDLIAVRRKTVYTRESITDTPWREAWEDAVERIIKKEKVKEPEKRFYREIGLAEIREEPYEVRKPDEEVLRHISERLSAIKQALKTPHSRRALETGNVENFVKAVRKYASGENKGRKKQKA